MLTVSVILPTFDRAYILREAIESVLNQTFSDLELIVVDDGSIDNTKEIVASYDDSRIRFLCHRENHGYSAALNTGASAATGELLAFEDSDDLWCPEKLARQVNLLREHPEVGGVFSDLLLIRNTERIDSMLRLYPRFSRLLAFHTDHSEIIFSSQDIYLCLLEEEPVKLQASVFRRDAAFKIGLFKETWRSGSDWEFALRFAKVYSMGYIDQPLTTQRTLIDSTLVRYKKEDAHCLMERFIEEEQTLSHDSQALAAVHRGIAQHATEFGSWLLREGNRHDAFKTYLRGFEFSRDPRLLLRCSTAILPASIRSSIKKWRTVCSSAVPH